MQTTSLQRRFHRSPLAHEGGRYFPTALGFSVKRLDGFWTGSPRHDCLMVFSDNPGRVPRHNLHAYTQPFYKFRCFLSEFFGGGATVKLSAGLTCTTALPVWSPGESSRQRVQTSNRMSPSFSFFSGTCSVIVSRLSNASEQSAVLQFHDQQEQTSRS